MTVNPEISIQPNRESPLEAASCDLFILAGQDYLVCTLRDRDSSRFRLLEWYAAPGRISPEWLRSVYANHSILQQSFAQVHVVYGHPACACVPVELYAKADGSAHLNLLFGPAFQEMILEDEVPEARMKLVYRIPQFMSDIHALQFPFHRQSHLFSLLVNKSVNEQGMEENRLHAIILNRSLILQVFAGGRLQLLRAYEYQQPEDIVYYMLHACQVFGLDANTCRVWVSGQVTQDSPLMHSVNQFFADVVWEGFHPTVETESGFIEYPAHQFSFLFNSIICESSAVS